MTGTTAMTARQEMATAARRFGRVVLGVFGVAIGLPSEVPALSTVRMELPEMVGASETIVHGSVVSTRSRWNDDRTLIVTEVRIRVLEMIKGEPAREIRVVQPGGIVGALRVEVPGVTPFVPGRETVLFLTRSATGDRYVTGLAQGRFDVSIAPGSGRRSVRSPSVGSEELAHRQESLREGTREELAVFLDRVRRLVR